MQTYKQWTLAGIIVLALVGGCGNQEDKAREMHNQALTLQRSGSNDAAKKIYEEIVLKYPSTQTAVEANKELLAVATIDAMTELPETIKGIVKEALNLYILDNGTCPTPEQGLEALVRKPTTSPVPRKWREGGYLDDPKYLLMVQSYACQGFRSEIVMVGE